LDAYKAAALNATANVAPTFAPQGGVQSEVSPASNSTGSAATSTGAPTSAAMSLHQFDGFPVSVFALLAAAVFGAVMAVF
jgi:hypothetical protein